MRFSTVCFAVVLAPATAAAQDWPRFRRPNGSGVGTSARLPVTFGPEQNLLWKTPAPPGHSSPIVAGGRLYLTGSQEDSLLTLAYDPASGRELWSRSIARTRRGKNHHLNNAASPTPAADAEGVVTFFQDFGLAAYSSEGAVAWQVPVDPVGNSHGMASSPVLAGSLVVQVLAGETGSRVLAIDRRTGEQRWEAGLNGVTYATPVLAAARDGGQGLVVAASTGEIVAFALEDGRRIWWIRQVPYQPKASPIVSEDGALVFVAVQTVGEESVRPLRDFDRLLGLWDVNGDGAITQAEIAERKGPAAAFPQIDVNGDGRFDRQEHAEVMEIANIPHLMCAIPAGSAGDATAKMLWVYRKTVPNVPSPLLYDGVFYVLKEGGIGVSFDPMSGAVWKEGRFAPAFGLMFSSPVAAGGKIYAISQSGQAAVVKAGREWEPLAVNELGEDCYATPALSGETLIVRTVGHLWCFRDSAVGDGR